MGSAFNNHPVLSIAAGTSGLRLPPGIMTPSYTFVTEALLDFNRYDAQTTWEIFGVLNGATTPVYLTYNTANGITVNQGDGNKNVTGAANVLARGQLHIRAVSFDAEALTSVQTLKDGSLFAFTHTSAYAPAVLDQWSIGSAADNAAIGFVGKMGISLISDRAMHGPTLLPFMAAAMNLVKTKYAVA